MPKKNFDNSQFSRNKGFDKQWRQEGLERLNVPFDQVKALATGGWQELQNQLWKIEAVMQPADMEFANAVVTGSIGQNEYQKRIAGFAPERRNLILYLLLILVTMSFLVSCAAPIDGTPTDVISPPTAIAHVENQPTDNPPAIESTATAFADLDIDYGDFTGFEPIVDPILEDAWQEIIDSGVASPLGIDVSDVTSDNILVKVKPGNGYDNDTYFTISNIPGHEGEIMTVSLAGVNRVAGGTAVRLALGVNGLPVGVDIDNNVVGYIDETGQWVAGSIELAPSLPGTPAEPEPTPAEVDYFDMSPEERLEQSQGFVEQATSYNGPISFTYTSQKGQTYQFYWNSGTNSWDTLDTLSSGGVPIENLDVNGENLTPNAATGWENQDGSLVLIHPITGEELTFPATVSVPGRGEIPIRELMTMNPVQLNNQIIDFTLEVIGDSEAEIYKIQNGMRTENGNQVRGLAYPAFVIGNSDFFPTSLAISNRDLPELRIGIDENHTDLLAIPIFSPETGNFMFWGIIQGGHVASVAEFADHGNGQTSYDFIRFSNGAFGSNGSGFGIFMEYTDPALTYYRGGFDRVISGDQPGMGDVSNIQTILTATTEQQIIDAFAQDGIIWSIPSAVAYSNNQ